jgi:ribosomal protein S12 methylthiotransferase accessory factor
LTVYRHSSSIRAAPLDHTLACAAKLAAQYGIVRVTDTTQLDLIGIPVFASIRPAAEPNSLCVHAGKGVRAEEARAGAYMEAIEFAAAEYRRSTSSVYASTPRMLADQPDFNAQFVDLCPILGREIDPDAAIMCLDAEDVATGKRVSVPAELVFFPYNENSGQRLFGTSTNGLCSGNTIDEATIHGICEVLERDIQSFNFVRDASLLVDCPINNVVEQLMGRICEAGLQPVIRYTPNAHGLPYFQSFILEPTNQDSIAISHGTGCHPVRDIAVIRALTEAVQGRLSYIHGGRDDLIERMRFFAAREPSVEAHETARMRSQVLSRERCISYSEVPDFSETLEAQRFEISKVLDWLVDRLRRCGFGQVLRVTLMCEGGLAVVRVIIPKLESFEPSLKRAGPRLRDHVSTWL